MPSRTSPHYTEDEAVSKSNLQSPMTRQTLRTTRPTPDHPLTAITTVMLCFTGCQDTAGPQIPGSVPGFETTSGGDDGSADETGEDTVLSPGECIIVADGREAERFQCKGEFAAHFGADGLGEESFFIRFGWPDSADSYHRPFVSACCGPLVDPPDCAGGSFNEHVWACTIDAVQQACIGLGTKVEEIRQQVPIEQALFKPSLASLRDWLNEESHITECMTTFLVNTGLSTFDCSVPPSQVVAGTTWNFSDTQHGLINNPFLRIDDLEVVDVVKPEKGASTCTDNTDNDTILPLQLDPTDPEWTRLRLGSGMVELNGPEIDGSMMNGTSVLASSATQCNGGECSSLALDSRPGASVWTLETLHLHSMGTSEASNGEVTVAVDGYDIDLFTPVEGSVDAEGVHRIGPGMTTLILSGRTALGDHVLPVTNANELVLEPGPDGWSLSDITILYEDPRDDVWQLTVSTAGWTAP